MSELSELERQVLAAAGDDAAWARLQQRHGPEVLRRACHALIGALVDEHRQALVELAGADLVLWLAKHRQVRDRVEARLGQQRQVPDPDRAAVSWRLLHRLMDAATAGMTMQTAALHVRVSQYAVKKVFRQAGVPLPWRQGPLPAGGVPATETYREALAVLRGRLVEQGVPAGVVAELGTWLSPPPGTPTV